MSSSAHRSLPTFPDGWRPISSSRWRDGLAQLSRQRAGAMGASRRSDGLVTVIRFLHLLEAAAASKERFDALVPHIAEPPGRSPRSRCRGPQRSVRRPVARMPRMTRSNPNSKPGTTG